MSISPGRFFAIPSTTANLARIIVMPIARGAVAVPAQVAR
jgi:hypothetical protein